MLASDINHATLHTVVALRTGGTLTMKNLSPTAKAAPDAQSARVPTAMDESSLRMEV